MKEITPSYDVKGEIRLFMAIIIQMFSDYNIEIPDRKSIHYNERLKVRREAHRWFSLKNRDFIYVCSIVGIDPFVLYDKLKNSGSNRVFCNVNKSLFL